MSTITKFPLTMIFSGTPSLRLEAFKRFKHYEPVSVCPGARSSEDLHYKLSIDRGHHQPVGCSGSDQISAECPYGTRGGETDDPRAGVRTHYSVELIWSSLFSFSLLICLDTGQMDRRLY